MDDFGAGIDGLDDRFEFSLILADEMDLSPQVESAIYDATDGDCALSYRAGQVRVHFQRRALTLEDAVAKAIRQIRSAGFHVLPLR